MLKRSQICLQARPSTLRLDVLCHSFPGASISPLPAYVTTILAWLIFQLDTVKLVLWGCINSLKIWLWWHTVYIHTSVFVCFLLNAFIGSYFSNQNNNSDYSWFTPAQLHTRSPEFVLYFSRRPEGVLEQTAHFSANFLSVKCVFFFPVKTLWSPAEKNTSRDLLWGEITTSKTIVIIRL